MSFGVPLSQLIQARADHVRSGIESLDDSLHDGFQPQSIYEVYGPPGIGKTKFGVQLVNNNQNRMKCLWIDTFQQVPLKLIEQGDEGEDDFEGCQFARVKKFAQLWYMFQNLKETYGLIIIDGLSQLLVEYLHMYEKNSGYSNHRQTLHDFKVKSLIQLLVTITKYATSNNTVVVLLNDAMNTGYQDYSDDAVVSYNDPSNGTHSDGSFSNFLVKSQRKRHVQVLKSGLVANAAVGGKDARWEVFLRCRIGVFWNWDTEQKQNPNSKERSVPEVSRQFVVQHQQPLGSNNKLVWVKTNESGKFYSCHTTIVAENPTTAVTDNLLPTNTSSSATAAAAAAVAAAPVLPPNKRRRILSTEPSPSRMLLDVQSHSQPVTPNSSQSIQFTPRIVHSDNIVATHGTEGIDNDAIIYDSEG
ncbi:Rad55 [Kluyveromyces lactis]|nr:Rad55 [Kluyveromyces lactis]